jgi:hypothetical protein
LQNLTEYEKQQLADIR